MAEQVVWNKKLLIVSLLLGGVAVGLFYLYDHVMRQRLRGEVVDVIRWKRDMKIGDTVTPGDVEVVAVPKATSLDGVARNTDLDSLIVGGTLSRAARKRTFVYLHQILEHKRNSPSQQIRDGYRAFPLRVDPNYHSGSLLSLGDRVDILGVFTVGNQRPKTYVISENLRVLSLGGHSRLPEEDFEAEPRPQRGIRVYRSLAVEVKPQVAVKLATLLAHVRGGKVWVLGRNPTDTTAKFSEEINPELAPLLTQPLPDDFEVR